MAKATNHVCAHVKKGVCPKCRNAMRPARSQHGVNDGLLHEKLMLAFVRAGIRVPRVKRKHK